MPDALPQNGREPTAEDVLKRVWELLENPRPATATSETSAEGPAESGETTPQRSAPSTPVAPKPVVDPEHVYVARRVAVSRVPSHTRPVPGGEPLNSRLQKELAACDEITRYFGFPYTKPPLPRRPLGRLVVPLLARVLNWYMKPSVELSVHTVNAVKELQQEIASLRREVEALRAPETGAPPPE